MREPGLEPGSQDWQPCILTTILLAHKNHSQPNLFKTFQ